MSMTERIPFQDPALADIWARIDNGGRLNAAESLTLFRTDDLTGLGWMARTIRRRLHGDAVSFVRNQVVNPSNVCQLRCGFCRFSVDADDPEAYDLEPGEIVRMLPDTVSEVHVVGGLHPDRDWEYYQEVVALIRDRPTRSRAHPRSRQAGRPLRRGDHPPAARPSLGGPWSHLARQPRRHSRSPRHRLAHSEQDCRCG